MRHLPGHLRPLFQEVDLDHLDERKHADSILARVLEFGRLRDVRWLVATYGWDRIHRFFKEIGHPEISPRTTALWRAILRAKEETWASPPAWRRSSNVPWVD
ncbi:MAG: hypothetical protein EXR72_21945 [Myxococcales bacterium]|nr:hypothetical protein [Myxococcales bacterium]